MARNPFDLESLQPISFEAGSAKEQQQRGACRWEASLNHGKQRGREAGEVHPHAKDAKAARIGQEPGDELHG